MSTTQVAGLCGVTSKTVGRWVDAGFLPAITTNGGHRRIRRDDVERFLEKQRANPTQTQVGPIEVVVFSEDPSAIEALKFACKHVETRFRVASPSDAFACGVILGEQPPELIVLDCDLTHLNPVDLCVSFKYHARTENCFLVVLTPDLDPQLSHELQNARADSVLPKPLDPIPCRHVFNIVRHRRR